MNKQTDKKEITKDAKPVPTGLDLLREPFEEHQIGKLPKPTKAQTEALEKDRSSGIRCEECGGWHHKDVIHLDYVGHAALTDRLLDCDPNWNWEPLSYNDGLPAFDQTGGLWIKLTVCGVTRIGYGHAANSQWKDIGAREKEVIGDALRNAAMRFGAALELWHKGQLHIGDPVGEESPIPNNSEVDPRPNDRELITPKQVEVLKGLIAETNSNEQLFLKAVFAESLESIPAFNYEMAFQKLIAKKKGMKNATGKR